MKETASSEVTNVTACPKCSSEVRDGSSFCYNCGSGISGSVAKNEVISEAKVEPAVSENGVHANGPGPAVGDRKKPTRRPSRPTRSRVIEPVQVVWRPCEHLGLRFVMLSIAAGIFALLLLVIAYYLK